jgi:hypothetical protein
MAAPLAVPATGSFWDHGVGAFLASSGFAGLAAVVAGSVAAYVAWRQLVATRETAQEERWWETLRWVYAVSSASQAALPRGVALRVLRRLVRDARSPLQVETARSLLGMFADAQRGMLAEAGSGEAVVPLTSAADVELRNLVAREADDRLTELGAARRR